MTDKTPVPDIINTILIYAVRDGARQIRFSAPKNPREFGFDVWFLSNGQGQLKMKIPKTVQQPIYEELHRMVGDENEFTFALENQDLAMKIAVRISATFQHTEHSEDATLFLRLEATCGEEDNDVFMIGPPSLT